MEFIDRLKEQAKRLKQETFALYLAAKMIPADVLEECRQQARLAEAQPRRKNWIAGGIILSLWLAAIVAVVAWLWWMMGE